jgi:hypothetical protein
MQCIKFVNTASMQNQLKQIYFIVRFGNGRYVSMKVVTEIQKTILNKFITPSDIKDISMKISDLIKSLEKIKAKHGDLPIAFEISDDDCCPIKKLHVTKVYDDDSTVSEAGFCEVRNLGVGEKYLNISDMLGG